MEWQNLHWKSAKERLYLMQSNLCTFFTELSMQLLLWFIKFHNFQKGTLYEGFTSSVMINWILTPGIDVCSCKFLIFSQRLASPRNKCKINVFAPLRCISFSVKSPLFGQRGWTVVWKDSQEQFWPITIEQSHLAVDREMNIQNIVYPNYFVFFLVFRHQFIKKFLCRFTWTPLIVLMR